MTHLNRFKDAQDSPHAGVEEALAELRDGRKRSHWIWYVFPQLAGLGTSATAQRYGITDVEEAEAYLRDPVLRSRLLAASTAVAENVRAGVRLLTLMGGSIDVLKLVSSLTLFGAVAGRLQTTAARDECRLLAAVAAEVLAAADAEGFPPCTRTLEVLARSRHQQPLDELLDRIKWDAEFGRGTFAIGYLDRVAHEERIVPLSAVTAPPEHPDAFSVDGDDGGVVHIPWHRVRTVYKDGVAIWHRSVALESL